MLSVALGAAAIASPPLFEFSEAPFQPPELPNWSAAAVVRAAPVEQIRIEPATQAIAADAPVEMPKPQEAPKTITTVQGTLVKQPALTPLEPTAPPKPAQQPSDQRTAIITYTIVAGDTLSGIAEKFGVTTQTLVWANNIDNPDALKVGAEIRVPPVSGVVHKVSPGDTLLALANRYRVEVTDITGFAGNRISDPNALVLGQEIVVPRGVKPIDPPPAAARPAAPAPAAAAAEAAPAAPAPPPQQLPPQPVAGGLLQWPTYGPIFTFFSAGHRGLDISPPYGTPVYAAEAGVVVEAAGGFNAGYGNYITIDHGNGFRTMYAHLSQILVAPGQRVARGEHIGRVGTSGRATGPHLHFEVHRGGGALNPLDFLPR